MKRGAEKERGWNSRGQVTIFIIIAIIIVAAGVLIYSFYPQLSSTVGGGAKSPPAYLQSCLEGKIKSTVNELSLQGGSLNPEAYIMFNDQKVEYLCYTSDYYVNCVVQRPLLKSHFESELAAGIQDTVTSCFNSMKSSYEGKGYSVSLQSGEQSIELLPKRVVSIFNYSLSLTKGSTQRYDSFTVSVNNNAYELVAVATNIIEKEASLGDADVSSLMMIYPHLKVEKNLRESGEKIYVITDRDTGDKFQFAVRSQAWPAGYMKPGV